MMMMMISLQVAHRQIKYCKTRHAFNIDLLAAELLYAKSK